MQELQRRLSAVKERLSAQRGRPLPAGRPTSAPRTCAWPPAFTTFSPRFPTSRYTVSIASVMCKALQAWYHSWHCMILKAVLGILFD